MGSFQLLNHGISSGHIFFYIKTKIVYCREIPACMFILYKNQVSWSLSKLFVAIIVKTVCGKLLQIFKLRCDDIFLQILPKKSNKQLKQKEEENVLKVH